MASILTSTDELSARTGFGTQQLCHDVPRRARCGMDLRAPDGGSNVITFPALPERIRREPVLGGLINENRFPA
ncbi:hypothetical protein [Catenulispora rubra]|uniref:hypothetical protein n=1 Tax=Catenulispora rubra TaxID=280293 RepID=UPI0018921A15|nr:hypothetical protein [Catenulispora rubra]